MRLFFCLCGPRGKVKGLDFGELLSPPAFLSSFPKINLRCDTSRFEMQAASPTDLTK